LRELYPYIHTEDSEERPDSDDFSTTELSDSAHELSDFKAESEHLNGSVAEASIDENAPGPAVDSRLIISKAERIIFARHKEIAKRRSWRPYQPLTRRRSSADIDDIEQLADEISGEVPDEDFAQPKQRTPNPVAKSRPDWFTPYLPEQRPHTQANGGENKENVSDACAVVSPTSVDIESISSEAETPPTSEEERQPTSPVSEPTSSTPLVIKVPQLRRFDRGTGKWVSVPARRSI
jgi:hypothetical protein